MDHQDYDGDDYTEQQQQQQPQPERYHDQNDDTNNQHNNTNDSLNEQEQYDNDKNDDNEASPSHDFSFRYYTGHKSDQTGHEFLEFQLRNDGLFRYANDSGYKRDISIRKEVKLNDGLFLLIKNMILDSNLIDADDSSWPLDNQIGEQQIEIKTGNKHIFFSTCKIGSKAELLSYNADPSLEVFYNLSHDLKQIFFDIIGLHFRLQEI